MSGIAVDLILVLLILLSVLFGVLRGFIKELFSLFVWGISAYLSLVYAKKAAEHYQDILPVGEIGLVSAFVILFIVIYFILSIFNYFVSKIVRKSALRSADMSLGGVFGLFRGVVMMIILVWLVNSLVPTLQNNADWQSSMLVFYFSQVPDWVMSLDVAQFIEAKRQWVDEILQH